jgi:methionyl aminopeptidase
LHDCLRHVATFVKPGVTTKELDAIAEEFIVSRGGKPSFKGYHGFPATLCISINEQCVHGIPGSRTLKEGDIVSLDGGVTFDDLITDSAITVPVGSISPEARNLLDATEAALKKAVSILKAGIHTGDLSAIIQKTVEAAGFRCTPALTGHGVGRGLHLYPDIPNVGKAGSGAKLPAGAVIAVEPIVSAGSDQIVEESDGWTIRTKDRALSAHFEHTLLVTDGGCDIVA